MDGCGAIGGCAPMAPRSIGSVFASGVELPGGAGCRIWAWASQLVSIRPSSDGVAALGGQVSRRDGGPRMRKLPTAKQTGAGGVGWRSGADAGPLWKVGPTPTIQGSRRPSPVARRVWRHRVANGRWSFRSRSLLAPDPCPLQGSGLNRALLGCSPLFSCIIDPTNLREPRVLEIFSGPVSTLQLQRHVCRFFFPSFLLLFSFFSPSFFHPA